jgi:hypothetical protein
MALGTLLIACPSCACHSFARETHCPSCGALLRGSDGSLQRTAGAIVLGLTLAVSTAACSSDTGSGSTTGDSGQGSSGQSSSGMGGYQTMSTYGVGPSSGSDSSSSGQGGSGGQGGAGGKGGAGGSK